ncbi:uncharacterized protein LOC121255048 [Juglans microcarpa x Juglans regia]|uniref:uncharacterized protein LOC121255048 n=1 Tax=Juglans microcarpa x Juglans regia TaxID=2249226 RepID=UPI001B7ED2E7|nr:uncharacterized protein LOC121255048 [Juglans microcarpa x Juglans regia]
MSTLPNDYIVYLLDSDFNIGHIVDPDTFKQALTCPESDKWLSAMEDEMNSMGNNRVWEHVELPQDAKAIDNKWIFKNLYEEVYMRQPKGFIVKGKENLCVPGDVPIIKGDKFNKTQCPRNKLERESVKNIPYASAVGSLMYAQVCNRPGIAYAVSVLSRFQLNPGHEYWKATKKVMRYLKKAEGYMLTF